jgi:hypothetical protein
MIKTTSRKKVLDSKFLANTQPQTTLLGGSRGSGAWILKRINK